MTKDQKVRIVYATLKEFLNDTSTGVHLDGNKVHMYIDCFGEFDFTIDPDSIKLFEEDE